MNFKWLTTEDFIPFCGVNVYHKAQQPLEIDSKIKNYHVLARARLFSDGEDKRLFITADDFYKLYINGRFVCQGPAPCYHNHYYYNEIDLTPFLEKGENVLAVHLYYQGLINRVWQSGDSRFGMGAVVESGKEKMKLNWKYQKTSAFSGDMLGYETDFLENFDSRLWKENWNQKDFDDSDWKEMIETEHDYVFFKQPTRQLSVYSKKPEKFEKIAENTWFVDLGTEIAGALRVIARGNSGDTVLIRYGEELNEDGSVRYRLRANCHYEEKWILSGGENCFENFCYKGFRFAEIVSEHAEVISAEAVCRHYPFDDSYCTLKTEDEKLLKIFELCKNTVKYATQDGFLDCPTREKGQYLGDAFLSGHAHALLTGKTDLLEKSIDEFAQSAMICPGLMAVAPGSLMQEIADYSLIFGEMVLMAYRLNQNKAFLSRYYPTVKNVLLYFKKYEREDGLLADVKEKQNLVDWPENLRDNYDFDFSESAPGGVHNVMNAYYIGAIKTLCKIETLLGLPKSIDFEKSQKAYQTAFFRENGLFADSETGSHFSLHSNALALYFDLVPESSKKTVGDFIMEKGLSCGVYMSYFVLKGLSALKRYDDVYQLLVNESEHGWMNMLKEGATTCFEAWGKEQKWNTSLCHPWATAPIPILLEDLKDTGRFEVVLRQSAE